MATVEDIHSISSFSDDTFDIISTKDARHMTILEVAQQLTPYGWRKFITKRMNEIEEKSEVIHEKYRRIYPYSYDVFNFLHITPFDSVSVIMMAQDPYPSPGIDGRPIAMGIAMSIRYPNKITATLRSIYRVLTNTVEDFTTPTHGDLTSWAIQGVLLLNAYLTVSPDIPKEKHVSWDSFTTQIVEYISCKRSNCVFMLWGNDAKGMKKIIEKSGNHRILEASHPVARGIAFEHDHFNEANQYLIEHDKSPIDWCSICY